MTSQMPRVTTAFAQRPLCAIAEVLLSCSRPYCAAMATPLRSLRATLPRVCFEHAESARRRSAFYSIPQRPMAMPLRCCRDAWDRTAHTSAICVFLGHLGIAVRTGSDRGLSLYLP